MEVFLSFFFCWWERCGVSWLCLSHQELLCYCCHPRRLPPRHWRGDVNWYGLVFLPYLKQQSQKCQLCLLSATYSISSISSIDNISYDKDSIWLSSVSTAVNSVHVISIFSYVMLQLCSISTACLPITLSLFFLSLSFKHALWHTYVMNAFFCVNDLNRPVNEWMYVYTDMTLDDFESITFGCRRDR